MNRHEVQLRIQINQIFAHQAVSDTNHLVDVGQHRSMSLIKTNEYFIRIDRTAENFLCFLDSCQESINEIPW